MRVIAWFGKLWRWFGRLPRRDKIDVAAKAAGVVVGLTVVASFIISIRGCQISQSANTTAARALEVSQHQFIQTNCPYVILKAAKFPDGQFLELCQRGKSVAVGLQYEVKNVGNVVAKHVTMPDKPPTGLGWPAADAVTTYKIPNAMTLGPGNNCFVQATAETICDDPDAASKELKRLESAADTGLLFEMAVEYANGLDESQKYRTFVKHKFFRDKVEIIKSDMDNLSEEAIQAEKGQAASQ